MFSTQKFVQAAAAGATLVDLCHSASERAGWWNTVEGRKALNLKSEIQKGTRLGKAIVAEKLALIHSEVSEGLEGHRKDKMDDHLQHRKMLEVELADAVIRIADLAGACGFDLGSAIAEKLHYNSNRPDHKPEARAAVGGKAI